VNLPLTGITVVGLEQAVAAPFATRQLADLGARVIKVERPGAGDFARVYDHTVRGMSSYFVWLNRGKESIALDLKDSADRVVLEALLEKADVLVQNLIPGAMDRLGLSDDVIRDRFPRIISCGISGYGDAGPYQQKKAYDLLIQCETGLLSINGSAAEPAKVGISVADIAAGMYAYSGVLTALYEREKTGTGKILKVAMLDALGEWMSQPYLFARYGGEAPARSGARHASIAPYGPYRAGDGGEVFIGVQNQREWAVFCSGFLGQPELGADPRFATNALRTDHNDELTPIIEQALSAVTADDAAAHLDDLGIANARLRAVDQLGAHPQFVARERFREIDSPVGPVSCLLPPVIAPDYEPVMGAVPSVGQHSNAIRAELGL
jgi:itaconate CoA-transferase